MDNFNHVEFDQVNGGLISRKALMEEMCRRCNVENEACPCEPPDCFVYNVIEDAPAVEAKPVRHGRWRFCGEDRWNDAFECSECGKIAMENSDYCPHCGEKMDGGNNVERIMDL